MNKIKPKKLCGKHILSGVSRDYTAHDAECIYFVIDGKTYRAVEDPEDGYRSCMKGIEIANEKIPNNIPDTEVLVSYDDYEDSQMLRFYETKYGKEVLTIGTNYETEWYPVCIFRYSPENLPCNVHRKVR